MVPMSHLVFASFSMHGRLIELRRCSFHLNEAGIE